MIETTTDNLERHRVTDGAFATTKEHGLSGVFILPGPAFGMNFGEVRCIVDDGTGRDPFTGDVIEEARTGWEHVSASTVFGSKQETPSWAVMAKVKEIFWRPDERVVQYHPPEDEYVNCHEHVLHLWRPVDEEIPAPPPSLVGPYSPKIP